MPRRRPRLRTILLIVNVLILLLPVGGIAILRLYENELIRGTEAQLIVQGAHVRDSFRAEYLKRAAGLAEALGKPLPPFWRPRTTSPELPDVIVPRLDISEERVRPPAPDSAPAPGTPDPIAAAAGAEIMTALQDSGRTTLTGIRIVDMRGVVVATTRTEMGHSLANREEVARALSGEDVSLLRERIPEEPAPPLASISRGQRYRVIVTLPVIDRGRILGAVVLARTPMDIQKAVYLSRWPILVGASALLIVVALVSALTAFTIGRPVRALIEQAERVARSERGVVVELREPGTHEVARLSEALGMMSRTLEERADYIRTFASHVSHELKTPLTTIRGAVELLRDHSNSMTAREHDRFLTILDEASARLERLVRRLLDLAGADTLRPGTDRTTVREALDRTILRFRDRGLDVQVDHGAGVGSVLMSEEIFDEIVSNLLDNARRHGGDRVKVRVVSRRATNDSPPAIELGVSDDGPGVPETDAERVFTAFFTTARDRGGSGLGLTIVRALLEAHEGSITLERCRPGASFLVRLPAGD